MGVLGSFRFCAETSETRLGDCEGDGQSSAFMLGLGLGSISLDVAEDMKRGEETAVKGSALVLCGARH